MLFPLKTGINYIDRFREYWNRGPLFIELHSGKQYHSRLLKFEALL